MRNIIIALALLLAGSGTIQAQDTSSDIQMVGELGLTDSRQRTIEVGSETFRVSSSVKVTADGGRIVDVFLLAPGQPVGIAWQGTGKAKTVTRIHVFDKLPQ